MLNRNHDQDQEAEVSLNKTKEIQSDLILELDEQLKEEIISSYKEVNKNSTIAAEFELDEELSKKNKRSFRNAFGVFNRFSENKGDRKVPTDLEQQMTIQEIFANEKLDQEDDDDDEEKELDDGWR